MSTQAVQPHTGSRRAAAPLPSGFESEVRLKISQVCALTGFGKSKLYEEIRAGRFPEPERSSKRCSRWRAGTVIEALNSKAAQ
jgi:predicted DNA-binding transcriptional regulator AlpA